MGRQSKLAREFKVLNRYGIHAKPAALFVKTASRFDADVTVTKGANTVSGKSVLGLLSLGASCGSKLTVRAEGTDAKRTLDELGRLIERKFEED